MNAPLLREREQFLVKKQSEGNGIRSLQMTADQLLFATLHLSLGNEGTIVSLSEIMGCSCLWYYRSRSQTGL